MRTESIPIVTAAAIGLLVVLYAYVLLPTTLGLGLIGGYQQMGPLGGGGLGVLIWIVLGVASTWTITKRVARHRSRLRTALYSALVASIVVSASFPLVVTWIYFGLTYPESESGVVPQGPVWVTGTRLYWGAFVASAIGVFVVPLALLVLRLRRRRVLRLA